MNEVLIMLDFLLGLIIGRSNPNQCFTDKKYNKYLENQRRIKEEAFRQREEKERKEREERQKKGQKISFNNCNISNNYISNSFREFSI